MPLWTSDKEIILFSELVSSLENQAESLKKGLEQLKANILLLETRWKKASDIEAKIFNLRLDQAILGINQLDKLVKDSEDQIKASEIIQKQIDALKNNPKALNDEEIEILQNQVI